MTQPAQQHTADVVPLKRGERKAIATGDSATPIGNSFTSDDRLFRDFEEQNTLFQASEMDLRALRVMLGEDGNPKKLEQVLTLPLRGAKWEIRGKGPEADLVRESLGPLLNQIISQATSAFAYKKAFFEVTWKLDGDRVMYNQVLLRPAVTCEAAYDDTTGSPDGFRQRLAPATSPLIPTASPVRGDRRGYVRVPANRSFIYTYGTHREPISGTSDFDVCLYNWKLIKKIEFLWCQYIEGQATPKMGVFGADEDEAKNRARAVAKTKASGVIPMVYPEDPGRKVVEIIESSGKGADQFEALLQHLEGKQTKSVLASFTDLAQAAAGGRGSNALSADQSEFFLAAEQGKADEIAWQIIDGLFKPLVMYNFGPEGKVPGFYIGPIGNRGVDRALNLLQAIMSSQHPTAPPKFTASLMAHVASFLGLEQDDVSSAAQEWAERQHEQEQYQQQLDQTMRMQQLAGAAGAGGPGGGPPGANVPGGPFPPGMGGPQPKALRQGQFSAGEQLTLDLVADSSSDHRGS